jgi:hypothetical protein
VAACSRLRVLTVGSFNLVRPLLGRQDLKRLEHLSFGGGFANKGLHLLFPLLELKSLHITVSRVGTLRKAAGAADSPCCDRAVL